MKNKTFVLLILAIAFLIALIYSNSLSVPFQFDDVKRVIGIPAAETLNVFEIFSYSKSRFILYLSFGVNYYFGQHNVLGYHLFNLLIHIISSIAVFLLTFYLLCYAEKKYLYLEKYKQVLSFFSALIFSLHPVQTESVTYIWQRAESMAGMFYFLALFLYVKFRFSSGKLYYLGCLMSMIACFFTKPTSATLPIAIFLCEVFFISKDVSELKRALKYIIPAVLLIAIPVLIARLDIGESRNIGVRLDPYHAPYYYTKLRVLVNSMRLLILPIDQKIEYNFTQSLSLGEPVTTFYSLIFHVALIVLAVLYFKKLRFFSFAVFWFYLTMSITTLLFLDDLFFEHYLYIPMYAYALLLPVFLLKVARKFKLKHKVWIFFSVFTILFYAGSSYARNKVWQTEISLWEDAVSKSPRDARANYTLGVYYYKAKRYEGALKKYNTALFLKPDYPEAYYRIGECYFTVGDKKRSLEYYKKATEVKPDFFEAFLNSGSVYFSIKDYKNARICYQKALTITDDQEYKEGIRRVLEEIKKYE